MHQSPAWRKLRKQRLALAQLTDEPCGICGQPIDYALPGNTPTGPTVDHGVALALGGEGLPAMTELRPAHHLCNSRQGGRISSILRAQRAAHSAADAREASSNARDTGDSGNTSGAGEALDTETISASPFLVRALDCL